MNNRSVQRLPFMNLYNKKQNENTTKSLNKSLDQNVQMNEEENYSNNIKSISKNKFNMKANTNDEMSGENEHHLCTKQALKEAIEENDLLRDKVQLIIDENNKLRQEIEDKDMAIVELAQFYEFCQKNHVNNCGQNDNPCEKQQANKRKSKSL